MTSSAPNRTLAASVERVRPVALWALRRFARGTRRLSAGAHRVQLMATGGWAPDAEWFDHYVDVHWQWPVGGKSLFLERGVLATLAMEPGGRALDLCCGDGFYCRGFYARRAREVIGVDRNPEAIAYARRVNAAPNVRYELSDITRSLPEGPFDNVMWDSAIGHFAEPEITGILEGVAERLAERGVLSGSAVIEPATVEYRFTQRAFSGKEDLARCLARALPHVAVFEVEDPERTTLYFYATRAADALPFASDHPRFLLQP